MKDLASECGPWEVRKCSPSKASEPPGEMMKALKGSTLACLGRPLPWSIDDGLICSFFCMECTHSAVLWALRFTKIPKTKLLCSKSS